MIGRIIQTRWYRNQVDEHLCVLDIDKGRVTMTIRDGCIINATLCPPWYRAALGTTLVAMRWGAL